MQMFWLVVLAVLVAMDATQVFARPCDQQVVSSDQLLASLLCSKTAVHSLRRERLSALKKIKAAKHNPSKHNKPRETYFLISKMYDAISDQCEGVEENLLVKKYKQLPYLPVKRCKQEFNPCPYDSKNKIMKLVVKQRNQVTVDIRVETEAGTKAALEVTYEEDTKCLCVEEKILSKPHSYMMPSNQTVPCVLRVVHVSKGKNQTIPCHTTC